jgi:hypothetical protein
MTQMSHQQGNALSSIRLRKAEQKETNWGKVEAVQDNVLDLTSQRSDEELNIQDGSSHKCMHGLGQRQVRHTVIKVPDVIRRGAEAVGSMNDELRLVVQAFHGAVVDGRAEVVEDVPLVTA